jgi:TolB-like protein/DNA-binding winged helix-turn-helix (wHTH) protein
VCRCKYLRRRGLWNDAESRGVWYKWIKSCGRASLNPGHLRFQDFELDTGGFELRRAGHRIRIERKPMELLILLVERQGQMVSRQEIVGLIWGKDFFFDADRGVNTLIQKIRAALNDDSDHPRFVETEVGKGYRFIGTLEAGTEDSAPKLPPGGGEPSRSHPARNRLTLGLSAMAVFLLVATIGGPFVWRSKGSFGHDPIQSLVVLPLQNLSGDAGQEYFAEGVTEELTTNLATIASLRVISRTSAMQYRENRKPVTQIAQELNVDAVVEGSIVRSGNRVRITAQLIDPRRDSHLWAKSYELEIGEILDVEDSVALDIAKEVRANLSSEERKSLTEHHAVQADAHEAYLRGRNELGKQRGDAIKTSAQYFQRAIDLDPLYAPGYAGLAGAFDLMANYFVLPPKDVFPRAEAAARQALELDPSLGEAHAALAVAIHHYEWNWSAAEVEHTKALAVSPGLAVVHLRYAEFLSNSGRHEEALREITRAQQLDPLSLVVASNLGRYLYYARRYDEAIQELNKVLMLDPNRLYTRIHLAQALEGQHKYPEAIEEFKRVAPSFGGFPSGLAHAYAAGGNRSEAEKIVRKLEEPSDDGAQDWYFIACVYVALGDKEKAFSWLGKASANHDYFLTFLNVDPQMDPLRADPRFGRLLQRIGLIPKKS